MAAPRALADLWSKISVPFWISATRIGFGLVFAHLVLALLPKAKEPFAGAIISNGSWLGAFDRWDAKYYVFIAQHGYPAHSTAYTGHSIVAFFPGFSLLVTAVRGVTFGSVSALTSAMVVAFAAFIAAAVLLYRLADERYGTKAALIATALFCWFPSSLFFMSPYSEGLFALEIILTLFLMERNRYLAAALVAGYASATSPEAVALTVALVIGALLARKGMLRTAAYAVVSGIGLGAYGLFLWVQFGNPFEFISVQKYWTRATVFPFVGLYRNVLAIEDYLKGAGSARPFPVSPTNANLKWVWILDDASLVLAMLALIGLVALALRRRAAAGPKTLTLPSEQAPVPWAFVAVAAVIVGIAACTTISPYAMAQWASTEGEARFVSVAMPLYLGGALLIRRWASLTSIAIGGFVVTALVFQALYNLGYWVT